MVQSNQRNRGASTGQGLRQPEGTVLPSRSQRAVPVGHGAQIVSLSPVPVCKPLGYSQPWASRCLLASGSPGSGGGAQREQLDQPSGPGAHQPLPEPPSSQTTTSGSFSQLWPQGSCDPSSLQSAPV